MNLHGIDRLNEAVEYAQKTIEILDASSEKRSKILQARLHRHLCSIFHSLGQPYKSLFEIKKAEMITRELNIGDWSLAWVKNQQAEAHRHLGQFAEAHQCLDIAQTLLDKYRIRGDKSLLLDYLFITKGHVYRDTYDYEQAKALYLKGGRGKGGPDGVMLAFYLCRMEHSQEALELAIQKWHRDQNIESPVSKANYQILVGVAYLVNSRNQQALIYLQEAFSVLKQYNAQYYAITAGMYLANTYFNLGNEFEGKKTLQYTLEYMSLVGYLNLDIWIPNIISEMCARAIAYHIETDFVEQLVHTRLLGIHISPILALLNETEKDTKDVAYKIVQWFGESVELKARQLIDDCDDESICNRVVAWMNSGWLTAIGVTRLQQLMTWRQMEIFLLWINPNSQGSLLSIGAVSFIQPDTVKKHLAKIRELLRGKNILPIELKWNSMEMYSWAIQEQLVNPHRPLNY